MKRTRVLAYFMNLYTMSAVAGYECTLKLAHTDDLNRVVAEKTLNIAQGNMNSGNMGTLYLETSLDINAVMNGWRGEEDATFVIIRRNKKRYSTSSSTVSEIMTIKGTDQVTGWFDAYKLDIACKVTNDPNN